MEKSILDSVPEAGLNSGGALRVPNTTNIYFDHIEGEAMVIALDLKGLAVSTGAACCACPAFGPGAACVGGTGGFVAGCCANTCGPIVRASATIASILRTLVFAATDAVGYVMKGSPMVLTAPEPVNPEAQNKRAHRCARPAVGL